jgi:hypothetical protein
MTKEQFEVEDPMELVGTIIPGDENTLDDMATAIVEEYALLGWDAPRLMTLFVNPLFLATHRIYRQRGDAYVRELIRTTCDKFRIPPRPQETDIFAPVEAMERQSEHGHITIDSPFHNPLHEEYLNGEDVLRTSHPAQAAKAAERNPILLYDEPIPDPGTMFVPLDMPAPPTTKRNHKSE